VRPAADLAVPGVQCRYLRGSVKEVNLGYSFAAPRRAHGGYLDFPPPDATLEPLTRVEVTSPPSAWTGDLVLEPGRPAAIHVAGVIGEQGLPLLWVTSVVLGVLLAVALPWAVMPREQREWTDWLWAAGVGAATGLSVWASLLLFLVWMGRKFQQTGGGRFTSIVGKVILALGGSGLGLFLLGCGMFMIGRGGAVAPVFAYPGLVLLALCWPAALVYLLGRVARRRGWVGVVSFVVFMLAHCGLACLVFGGLWMWMSAYG
jgi:hypothetical protein